MALTGDSTFDEAMAQYNNNLAWVGNPTKAANLYESVLWLLVNRPMTTQHTGVSMTHESLQALAKKLEGYLEVAGSSSVTRRASFVRARGKL